MTISDKPRTREPLRQLDAADLGTVVGGIIIYGSTALGGPDTVDSRGGIVGPEYSTERAIMFWTPA